MAGNTTRCDHEWFASADAQRVNGVHAGRDDGQRSTGGYRDEKGLVTALTRIEQPFFGDYPHSVVARSRLLETAIAEFGAVQPEWVNHARAEWCPDEPDRNKSRSDRDGQANHNHCGDFPWSNTVAHGLEEKFGNPEDTLLPRYPV